MRKYLVVIAILLTVGFLAGSLRADARRDPGVRQGTRIGAHRPDGRSGSVYVTRPFVGVNRRYTTTHRDRYDYRRPTWGDDGAFRVLPHSYYYGYSYPRYVAPQQYYYYYDYPQSGIIIYWSW